VAIAWPSALQLFVTAGGSVGHGSVRNALLGALAAAKRWEMAMELMPQVEKTWAFQHPWCPPGSVSKGSISIGMCCTAVHGTKLRLFFGM
jgi:hypothetical protein